MIAVTGSHGFIGPHVVRACRELGGVLEFDRKHPETPIDLMHATGGTFAGCDTVIHLAAHADVQHNWANLDVIERDNLLLTLRVLEAARRAETVRRFVFVSTGSVYSKQDGWANEWDRPVVQESPYAASKIAGEAYTQAYAAKCGWSWYVLRPAACIGSGYHHGHIADFVRKAKEGPIVPLDSGRVPRATVHVKDMASACVKLLTEEARRGTYNVASNTLWTWRQTVDIMRETRPVEVCPPPDRPNGWTGDGRGAKFDVSLLRKVGWEAVHPVSDGVRDALATLGWP